MAKNFQKLIFGGLHEKHAVQPYLDGQIRVYIAFRNRTVRSKVKSMSKSKVKVTLRPTASQSVCPGA
jgi:hypothetical protein